MASLTQLYKKQTVLAIADAHVDTTSVTMRLASSVADSHGFIVKDIPKANFGEIPISSAELTTLFGASDAAALMLNGNASPLVTVHVTQKNSDGLVNADAITTLTSFTGGEDNKLAWLLLNAPAQPIVANAVTTLNKNYTFVTQVRSRRPLVKGIDDNAAKAKVSVELHKVGASANAQGSFVPQIVYATILTAGSFTNNYVNTLEILGDAGLDNDSNYEMQFTVYNLGEDGEQASPASAQKRFTPNSNPAAPLILAAKTTLTADLLPSYSYPVTLDANWSKSANTTSATIRVEKWANGYYQGQRTELAITDDHLGAMQDDSSSALPSIQIPIRFFDAGQYSAQVRMRIMTVESDGASGNGNWSDNLTIKKAVVPVMSDLNIRQNTAAAGNIAATYGVNAAGQQVVQGSFSNVGEGALTHTKIVFGADAAINNPDNVNRYQTTHNYANINGAINKIVIYRIEKEDPNGTQVNGGVHKYVAEKSITLMPFKAPDNVAIDMSAGVANTAPSYVLTLGAVNGNTVSKYVVKAKYQAATTNVKDAFNKMIVLTSPDPYTRDFTFADATDAAGTPIVATANIDGESYVPGQYKIEVTTESSPNLGSLAAQYVNTYEMSVVNESLATLFFKTPTISRVSYLGKNMTITGSTQGSNMSGLGSVNGYTFWHQDDEGASYSIQNKENTGVSSVNVSAGVVSDIFNFESVLTFDQDIRDLSLIAIDGLVMLDPSDAPSVLKFLTFADPKPALDAATAAQSDDTADRAHNAERLALEAAAATATANYNNALAAAPSPSVLSDANTALNIAQLAYDEVATAKTAAQADVTAAATAKTAAQTEFNEKDNAHITLYREVYGYDGVKTEDPEHNDYEPAIVGTDPALVIAQNALTAAIAEKETAQSAFENKSDDADLAAALVAADEALVLANAAADEALAANNSASQDQINANNAKVTAQTALTAAQTALTDANQVLTDAQTALTVAQTALTVATATKIAAQSVSDTSALVVKPLLSAKNSADAAVVAKGPSRNPDSDGLDAAAHILAVNAASHTIAVLTDHN